jgi:polyferredoxin
VRSKLIGYALLLVIMSTMLILEIVNRVPLSLDISRDRTELAKENFNGDIENVYTLKILNMSQTDNTYKLSVKGINNTQWHGEQQVTVKAATVYTLPISVSVDPYELEQYMTDIIFTVEQLGSDSEVKIEQESRFFNKR